MHPSEFVERQIRQFYQPSFSISNSDYINDISLGNSKEGYPLFSDLDENLQYNALVKEDGSPFTHNDTIADDKYSEKKEKQDAGPLQSSLYCPPYYQPYIIIGDCMYKVDSMVTMDYAICNTDPYWHVCTDYSDSHQWCMNAIYKPVISGGDCSPFPVVCCFDWQQM